MKDLMDLKMKLLQFSRLEGLNESDRQLDEGHRLLDSVIKMMEAPGNGVQAKINTMKQLWSSMKLVENYKMLI